MQGQRCATQRQRCANNRQVHRQKHSRRLRATKVRYAQHSLPYYTQHTDPCVGLQPPCCYCCLAAAATDTYMHVVRQGASTCIAHTYT